MKKNVKFEYHYLDMFGEFKGLNKRFSNLKAKNYYLVLDSSVCLDIIDFINKKKQVKEKKVKAFELIKFAQKKSFPIFDMIALLELSVNKLTQKIDTDKFHDMKMKLDFAFKFPFDRLKKGEFDFKKNYYSPTSPDINNNASVFLEQIYIFYCSLLKMREIAKKNGLNKHKSKKNIIEFIDWMDTELDMILGLEYQLSVQIFGGNNHFRPMIKDMSEKEKALKAIWGTAWDLFHSRFSRNSSQLSKIVDEDVNSVFVTNDKRLYELLAPEIDSTTEFGNTRMSIMNNRDSLPPHLDDDFVDEMNTKFIDILESREQIEKEYPEHSKVMNLIKHLENNIT